MGEDRAATTATPTTATLLMILALAATSSPGCGRDAHGPILAGGRGVKAWVADLSSPEPRVRRQAVLKLGNVGDEDPAAADALAGSLDDPDPLVRRDVILAVAKLKNPSAAIRGRLETLSRSDEDPRARDLAREAVVRLGGVE